MINKNIDNLTSLWKTVGKSVGSYFEEPKFNYSLVHDSDWPNRIWFNSKINIKNLKAAVHFLLNNSIGLTIPRWDNNNTSDDELFEMLNLILKFKQVGMSMKLDSKFDFQKRLIIKKISSPEEIKEWVDIYPQAFGYKISRETLIATNDKINYYLAILNKEPIGTAIVHKTNNVSGIHGVGVIPSARRKGFAEEIMKHVINESIDNEMEYSTLQASEMGKGIYLRLGYSEDFTINNYILN